jgi:hypothetical protein
MEEFLYLPHAEIEPSLQKGGNATSFLLSSQWIACVVPQVTHDRTQGLLISVTAGLT